MQAMQGIPHRMRAMRAMLVLLFVHQERLSRALLVRGRL